MTRACFFIWLLLTSCLGDPIIRQLREIWDSAIRSARLEDSAGPRGFRTASARRRRELGFTEADSDLWEMDTLAARRGG